MDFKIKERSLRYDINISQAKEIIIKKTDEVRELLKQFLTSQRGTKYLSPSALSTYMHCSLQFYFRYIAQLREHDDITEEIDAPLFGNILHETIDFLYKDFIGKNVSKEDIQAIKREKINDAIDLSFKIYYFKKDRVDYAGKNIIIRDVIEKYVLKILKIDADIAPFEIISLEDTYEIEIPLNINGFSEKVKLGGKIDRVDKLNDQIRIIDYKTGQDHLEFKNIEALFSKKKSERNTAVFQTLLYGKFYNDLKNPGVAIIPGVYSVRKLFGDQFDFRIFHKESKSYINDYKSVSEEFL